MQGIDIYETLLIILYVRNRYELFLYCINVNQRWNVICLKLHTNEKD